MEEVTSEFTELIPSLPEDLALECLTRLHYSAHQNAASVCRRWRQLLHAKSFYYHRKRTGFTRTLACLAQHLPSKPDSDSTKTAGRVRYGISVFDLASQAWEQVDPIPEYPDGLPLFCQITSLEGKLFVMGGWDPETYEPLRKVFVYEFTTRRWRRVKDMPDTRTFFAAGGLSGKIIVAGGHDDNKSALRSAWAYNVDSDEWSELSRMSQERDECEGLVMGQEFWVVSGYRTESQGSFEGSVEIYDVAADEWRRVEEAWEVDKCPRSRVGVSKDGKLFTWGGSDSRVQVGACAVSLGDCSVVAGAEYQGGPHGFYLVEPQNGRLVGVEVPEEFSSYVQSGCRCEI